MVIILAVYRWEKGHWLGLSRLSVNLVGRAQAPKALLVGNKVIPREQNWAKATPREWWFTACFTDIIDTV